MLRVAEGECYCAGHGLEVADREARLWAMEHYRRVCQRCGSGAHDVHHIRGKGAHPRLRHERANLLPLCRTDHAWAHAQPAAFREWVEDRWPELPDLLTALELSSLGPLPQDRGDIIRAFREADLTPAEADRYGAGAW